MLFQKLIASLTSIDFFIENFKQEMLELSVDLFKETRTLISDDLSNSDNSLELNSKTLKTIKNLDKFYSEIESNYLDRVDDIIKNFDNIEKVTVDLNSEINKITRAQIAKAGLSDLKINNINSIADQLASPESFKINITTTLKRLLYSHASIGTTKNDLIKNLANQIFISNSRNGSLFRYVNQVAHDSIFLYERAIEAELAKLINYNGWAYVGPLVEKSRPQCIRWVLDLNGFISKEILPSEIDWAKQNGKGYSKYLPELTVESFPYLCGGHNCNHKAIAVNKQNAKIDEIQKEYDKANKELSETIYKNLDEKTKKIFDNLNLKKYEIK